MEHKIYDVMMGQMSPRPPSPVPILIAIDDKALSSLGQWPWPRHHLARLVALLHEAKADVVVLDLILSTRDRTSPLSVQEDLRHTPGVDLSLKHIPRDFLDHDHVLAQTLKDVPCVLGYKLLFPPALAQESSCELRHSLSELTVPDAFSLFNAQSALCTLPTLGAAARDQGFINALHDTDGVVRRVPLMATLQNQLLPSLVLATIKAGGKTAIGLGQDLDGGFVQLNGKRVHIDDRGNLLLRYRGPKGTFQTISVADVLKGGLPDLTGRIAIVGPTAAGLGDNHITPLDRTFPGVEIHATILDNLLNDDALIRPFWAIGAEACAAMAAGVFSSLLMMVTGPLTCVLGLAGGAFGLWAASLQLLDGPGYWLSPFSAELALILNMAILSLIKYGMEERELRIRSQQLVQAQDATILSLTALAETRDPETGGHIKRTREYVLVLARYLAGKPKFKRTLDRDTVELLHKSAPLHDIGKVGIADSILLKSGRLSSEEWQEMQRHTTLGAETLAEAEKHAFDRTDRSYLALARDIAYSHHEKWDGTGYPQGLRGEEIPLGGRLMALADVYDALISKRVYKDAMSHAEAVEIIKAGRSTHFDPDIVDAFLETQSVFEDIATRYT